jgi:hypothetical protein
LNDLERLAAQLAERHRIPKSTVSHPEVVFPGDDGFMAMKMKEDPDYVPYCLVKSECGRVRRTPYGFQCPTCGNQMNYDLTHYDGNKKVQYVGDPAPAVLALAGFPPVPGEYWKFGRNPDTEALFKHRAEYAERKAWNDKVDEKKSAKNLAKAVRKWG